ncbi:MAG: hypothetical protein AMXMBFR83_17560 [Phycisphaerae bacterium]
MLRSPRLLRREDLDARSPRPPSGEVARPSPAPPPVPWAAVGFERTHSVVSLISLTGLTSAGGSDGRVVG